MVELDISVSLRQFSNVNMERDPYNNLLTAMTVVFSQTEQDLHAANEEHV